jgi:hypothetical protein
MPDPILLVYTLQFPAGCSGMTIDLFMPVLMPEHREEIYLAKQVNTHA